MTLRPLAGAFAALALLAACSDDTPDAACSRWDQIAGTNISDTQAVATLNRIADEAENGNVRDKAIDLATLLERNATQTEVHAAFQNMDAACTASG